MKLQLSNDVVAKLALNLGSSSSASEPRDVASETNRVLDALIADGLVPLTRKDVTAVLGKLGTVKVQEAHPDVTADDSWKVIGTTIAQRCVAVPNKKGFWAPKVAAIAPKLEESKPEAVVPQEEEPKNEPLPAPVIATMERNRVREAHRVATKAKAAKPASRKASKAKARV